jgi:hypothetical protein
MSIYPSPRLRDGVLNTVFNNTDFIKDTRGSGGGLSLTQTDALYLKNSGVVVSSANTTFNGTLNVGGLMTVDNIKATASLEANTITASLATIDTLKAKNSSDTLTSDSWRADQVYSFPNGMVYSIKSDTTAVNSVSFINIPTTINQSYIFTFILQPSVANSPYYIKSNNNTINVNGSSIQLYGLQNVSLPTNYTFLVQQISIIYDVYGKQFFALTFVSGY